MRVLHIRQFRLVLMKKDHAGSLGNEASPDWLSNRNKHVMDYVNSVRAVGSPSLKSVRLTFVVQTRAGGHSLSMPTLAIEC